MAKSKSGGTRSYLRGRVGADVYSVGRDASGKRQQVVRSLAETVANPQTVAQMRGRMIMSTLMQVVAALKPIIDHSFDNVSGVQPNISEFISRNYALIKADVEAHPNGGNAFGLNAYGEKGAKQGAYVVADGRAAFPLAITYVQGTAILTIAVDGESLTVGALKEAWEVGKDGYLTIVGINSLGAAEYARLHLNYNLADNTVITADNLDSVFTIEGDASPAIAIDGMNITASLASIAGCGTVIVTRKTASGFIHSKATLGAAVDLSFNASQALPSYPIGQAKFLNGGSVDGGSAPVSPVAPSTPDQEESPAVRPHMTTFQVAGSNALTGSATTNAEGSVQVNGVLSDKDATKAYAIVRKSGSAFQRGVPASDNAVSITGTSISTTFDAAFNNTYYFALTEDGTVIQVLGSLNCTASGSGFDEG